MNVMHGRLQEQARRRGLVRQASHALATSSSPSPSPSALSKAERDLADNIDGTKRFSTAGEREARGGGVGHRSSGRGGNGNHREQQKDQEPWGSLAAFRLAQDMRAARRFVPWYKKLPVLASKGE
jgi:hypothetical protein